MLSLASADLCVGLISPLNAYMEQRGVLFQDMFARKLFCMVLTSLEAVLLAASIYHVLAMSIDRLYLIEKPFKFMKLKTNKWKAYQTALICWLLALLPAAPLWTDWDTRTDMNTDCWNICSFPYDSVSITVTLLFLTTKKLPRNHFNGALFPGTMDFVCRHYRICYPYSDYSQHLRSNYRKAAI